MTFKKIKEILKKNDKEQLIALFFDEKFYHLEKSVVIALFNNPDIDLINSLLIANRNTDYSVYKDFNDFLNLVDADDDEYATWFEDYYIDNGIDDFAFVGFNFSALYYSYIVDELPKIILKKIETLEIKDIEILIWLKLDSYLTIDHVLSLTDNAIKKFIKAHFMMVKDYLDGEFVDEHRENFQWKYKKTLAKHFKQLIKEKVRNVDLDISYDNKSYFKNKKNKEEIRWLVDDDGWLENIEKTDLIDLLENEDLFLDRLVSSIEDSEFYLYSKDGEELVQFIFDYVFRNLPVAEKKSLLELQALLAQDYIYKTKQFYDTWDEVMIPGMSIRDNHINGLILKLCNLKKLPDSIGNLKHLEYLNVSHNELEELPETIGRLKNLKELNMSYNKLIKLPDSLGGLLNLEKLEFEGNLSLIELPETIWNLKIIDQKFIWLLKDTALSKISKLKFIESQKEGNEKITFDDAFKLYLAKYDLSDLGDQLLDLLRFKIRVELDSTRDFTKDSGISRCGGDPDVPKNFKWPYWNGEPLDFLLQVNLADTKHYEANQIPFKEGFLHVFFSTNQETNDKNSWKIMYTNTDKKDLVRMKNPSNSSHKKFTPGLMFFKDISLPTPWTKSIGEILPNGKARDNYESMYEELLALDFQKRSHWMFGFPFELAGPGMELKVDLASRNIDLMNLTEADKKRILQLKEDNWVLLFSLGLDQINHKFEWYKQQGEILYIWIDRDDLKDGNFENVIMVTESRSYTIADFKSVKQLKEECSVIPFDGISLTKSQIRTFLNELAGENACQYSDKGFRCGKGFHYSREVLNAMKIPQEEQEKFIEKCQDLDGGCDCEILMNTAERLLGEYTPW